MSMSCGKIRIEDLGNGEGTSQMARNVRAGLLSTPKDLSPWPKYFYDEEGSELFEEITALPEYYQTRTELSILQEKAPEIVARTRCLELLELGSGSASKTRVLLEAMMAEQKRSGPVRYVPLDVSESALHDSARRLLEEYPALQIHGFVGDFDRSLEPLLARRGRTEGSGRLVVFLGGTIGNFTPERRRSFLSRLRAGLEEGDYLLVGVDLVKDARVLEAAYDDAAGVTARFNKNLLNVLNRKLGAEFDPTLFAHRAFYDAHRSRVELWLDSKVAQEVPVLGFEVPFEAGEGMRTEISAKFTRPTVKRMFEEAGFVPTGWYTDEKEVFGLALGRTGKNMPTYSGKGGQVVRIIKRNEGRYEVEEVEFGRVYKWCPEHVVVECDCGERMVLTYSATTCGECGADHAIAVRKELAAIKSGDQTLRPWRSWHSSEDTGIPF